MESLLVTTVSDPLRLPSFVESEPAVAAVVERAVGGGLGVGFFRQGEMLVRKVPVRQQADAQRLLGEVSARHALVYACDGRDRPFAVQAAPPLRHRDWLFMMAGTIGDDTAFVGRVVERLRQAGLRGPEPVTTWEGVLAVMMTALASGRVLERRGPVHGPLHQALRRGLADVAELAGGIQQVTLALCLHTRGMSLGLAAGRPLYLGLRPGQGGAEGRGRPDPMRAAVLTDQPTSVPADTVGPWEGVLIGDDCRAHRFPAN